MTALPSAYAELELGSPSADSIAAGLWNFSVNHGSAGLEALRDEWLECIARDPRMTYLQSPEWFSAYLNALAPCRDSVHFVTARLGRRLSGVLVFESLRLGAGFVRLRLITGEHMHLADVAAPSGAWDMWREFVAWLNRRSDLPWLFLSADGVCADSTLAAMLPRCGPDSLTIIQRCSPTLWLDCSIDAAHALRDVGRGHKQNVKRLLRRARGLGTLSYEAVTAPGELDAALDRFLEVEASGWKAGAGSAIRLHPQLVVFYRRLAREFGARGACRINLLRLNDEVIAAQFGLISNGQLNLLKIAFADQHSAIAPGHLIMQHTIESVCADPSLSRLSFVTKPPWAHLWKPEATQTQACLLFRDSVPGRFAHWATRAWRARPAWARSAAARTATCSGAEPA